MAVFHFLQCWRTGGYVGANRRRPAFHSPKPGRERGDCRGDGRVSGYLSSRSDSHDSIDICVCADHIHSGRTLDRLLVPHTAIQRRCSGTSADGRCGLLGAHWRLHLRGCHGASLRRLASSRLRATPTIFLPLPVFRLVSSARGIRTLARQILRVSEMGIESASECSDTVTWFSGRQHFPPAALQSFAKWNRACIPSLLWREHRSCCQDLSDTRLHPG